MTQIIVLSQWLSKIVVSRKATALKALDMVKKGGVIKDIKGAVYFYQFLNQRE